MKHCFNHYLLEYNKVDIPVISKEPEGPIRSHERQRSLVVDVHVVKRLFLHGAVTLIGETHVQCGVEVSGKTEHCLLSTVLGENSIFTVMSSYYLQVGFVKLQLF